MKKLFFALSCLGLLAGCTSEQKVTPVAQQPQLLVINVLDSEDYADAHIKGSINIPFASLVDEIEKFDKATPIVLYCSNFLCSTSDIAAQQLKRLGFEHVQAYEGGMAEWYQLGLPTEGPAQKGYLKEKHEAPTEINDETVISAGKLKDLMSQYGLL